jgi:hypothetical protein
VRWIGFKPAATFASSKPGETEWGYVWESLDGTIGQPRDLPLADWERFLEYLPPDPHTDGRMDGFEPFIEENKDKFIIAGLGISGFNQATFLRGFEALLEDLYTDRMRAEAVLDVVFEFEIGIIGRSCCHNVDAISFADDWGTQKDLMISPDLWRQVFRPRYAKQFDQAHRAGKLVWFHSCGDLRAIIPDLIDIGVDVLELLQPDIFGVEYLATNFGGKVCFCCSVDHQRRAVSGTRAEVFAYARHLRDQLGRFNGGFIGYIEDYPSLGMSNENYQWISEAFQALNE